MQGVNITTYHGDPLRTGWNPDEYALAASNVTPTTFGLLASITLSYLCCGAELLDTGPISAEMRTLSPPVANGMVYVASYRQLAIFGLISPATRQKAKLQQPPLISASKSAGANFWGTVKSIDHSHIGLVLRTGKLLDVDLSEAFRAGTSVEPVIGEYVAVNGELDEYGVLEARVMWRAKAPQTWGTDGRY